MIDLERYRKAHAHRLTCSGCGCDLGFPSSDPYADPDCLCCLRAELDDTHRCPTLDAEPFAGKTIDAWLP